MFCVIDITRSRCTTYQNLHTTPSRTLLNPVRKRFNRPSSLFQSYGAFQIFPDLK